MKWSINVDAIIAFQNVDEIRTVNQYRCQLTISHFDLFECPLDVGCRAVFHATCLQLWINIVCYYGATRIALHSHAI